MINYTSYKTHCQVNLRKSMSSSLRLIPKVNQYIRILFIKVFYRSGAINYLKTIDGT